MAALDPATMHEAGCADTCRRQACGPRSAVSACGCRLMGPRSTTTRHRHPTHAGL